MSQSLSAIVLAAGNGTRMRSDRPKPLHVLVGKPMVVWVLDALRDCAVGQVSVVVGHGGDRVTKRLVEDAGDRPLAFVTQHTQRGTGDATAVGLTGVEDTYEDPHDILVLAADTPLLRPETIAELVATHRESDSAATVLTAEMQDPTGYGRIIRGRDDAVVRIVEQGDATPEELAVTEVNTAIYCFRKGLLAPALRRIQPDNAQGEFYLPDVIEVLAEAGHKVSSLKVSDPIETHGINDRRQLASAEAELRRRINEAWMAEGVTFLDPANAYLDATVTLDRDVTIYPNTILQGTCEIGVGADVGPAAQLVDTKVGAGARVHHTVSVGATIGAGAEVGPWAALGPGDEVASGVSTGPHYAGPYSEPAASTH